MTNDSRTGCVMTSDAAKLWPGRTVIQSGPRLGRKLVGGCALLGEGELHRHLTQCRLRWGLPPYQVVSWYI